MSDDAKLLAEIDHALERWYDSKTITTPNVGQLLQRVRDRIAALEKKCDGLGEHAVLMEEAFNRYKEKHIAGAFCPHCHPCRLREQVAALERQLADETKIVDRIWDLFGRPSYESLNGRSLVDLIAETQRQLAEARKHKPQEEVAIVEQLRAEASAHRALYEQWHDSDPVDRADCRQMLSMAALLDKGADLIESLAEANQRVGELEDDVHRRSKQYNELYEQLADCPFCGADKGQQHNSMCGYVRHPEDNYTMMRPTYHVRHPDDSYTVANPQPEARPIPREATEERIEQMETALMNAEDSILGVANAIRRCLSQNADTDIKDARSAGAPDIPNIETDPSLLSRLRDAALAQPEGEKK